MIYTEKQRELMRIWQRDELKRLNILEGSVSSGKTWISLVLWAFWVATMPKNKQYLMCGKSLKTLKRNCLVLLEELVGSANFKYSLSAKEGTLFGRVIELEGANDAKAETKIRGMTLQGAYCDELTLFPKEVFEMLTTRLRLPKAKLIGTTNPDNPRHWLKVNYLDRKDKLSLFDMSFLLDDNTTLDPEYVENLKLENTGVFYDRFIKGEWKAAEGAIYRDFADAPQKYLLDAPPDDIAFCTLGMDFGGNGSAHAIVCTGYSRRLQKVVAVDEYYRKEIISPLQLERDTVDFVRRCKSKYKIADMYCDSAEQVLIKGIKGALAREKIPINVHNARKGAIIDRIRFTCLIMAAGRFFVTKNCKHLIEAFSDAVWNGKQLDDTRLDDGSINIDSLDAFEYSIEPYMNEILNLYFSRKD